MPKVQAVELEISVAGRYPLRLTALAGSGPFSSTARLLVRAEIAAGLIRDFPGHVRQVGPSVEADLPVAGWVAKVEPKPAASPVATAAAEATAKKGVASNRSMAGKPAAEAKA